MSIVKKTTTLIGIAIVASALFTVLSQTPQVNASSTSSFDPARIIDDTIFFDSNSMSVSQIQNFLDSKMPSCDTNGDGLYNGVLKKNYSANNPPPYTCLKDYYENPDTQQNNYGGKPRPNGSKSAARLIYESGQRYGINPQVLIVFLQKEQGLITDDWPWERQYEIAMGYGCPDTAPCDEEYYGFANQVDKAAYQLNRYTQYPDLYNHAVGSNYVLYHPNASCGGTTVNIETAATAALYNYTPYQPNQAALNAGYGTGNGCSAYGNRNFYLYFNDWFGSTTKPLFKVRNGGETVYYQQGGTYYPIPSPSILEAYGLSDLAIDYIDQSQLDGLVAGPALGRVVRFGSNNTVHLVDRGNRYPVPTWSTLERYGYDSSDLTQYADVNLRNILTRGDSLSYFARRTNGAIYYFDADGRHVFPDGVTFNSAGPELSIDGGLNYVTLSNRLIKRVPASYPILLDGKIVKARDSATVYLYDDSQLMPFSASVWSSWGKKLNYSNFKSDNLREYPVGERAPTLISDGTNRSIVQNGKKYRFNPADQTAWGLDDTEFTTLTTTAYNRLSNGGSVGTVIRQSNGAVSSVINGERIVVPSTNDFKALGYEWSQVLSVDRNATKLLPNSSSLRFGVGSLIRQQNGAVFWIDDGLVKHPIPSISRFNQYGFSWSDVRNYSSGRISAYTNSGTLEVLGKSLSGKYYLASDGELLAVPQRLVGPDYYNLDTQDNSTVSDRIVTTSSSGGNLTEFVSGSSATVYKIEDGSRRPIASPSALFGAGGTWKSVVEVPDIFLKSIPKGDVLR